MNNDSCYLTLGLNRGAPSEEIRRAYRHLSMKLHPDASGDPATARKFSRMLRAYKVLTAVPAAAEPASKTGLARLVDQEEPDLFQLGSRLVQHPEPASRAEAAKLLGLSGKRSVWVFLRRGLSDGDERVVCSCIRAAAVLGLAQGGGELASAYIRSSLPCRRAILRIAEATQAGVLLPVLHAASQDEFPELRLTARRILVEYQAERLA